MLSNWWDERMDRFCRCLLRSGLRILILVLLLENPIGVFAQAPPAPVCQASNLSLVGQGENGKDFLFHLEESLQIKASGGCVEAVSAQLKAAGGASKFTLVLDQVSMANLPVTVSELPGQQEIILAFQLIRRSEDSTNRKAWDAVLGKQHGTYEFTIPVALAVGDQPAWGVRSASPVTLHLAKNTSVWMTFAVGVTIFLVAYYRLVKHQSILRDRPNGFYSLGKSQMAFWGLLVVLTFAGIWLLSGRMEELPAGVLILIGISAATSLGSKVIGDSQKVLAASQSQNGSVGSLEAAEKKTPTVAVPVPAESEAGTSRMNESQSVHESAGFWHDICDDGNGMSFHRLQVVMWTVVLGVIFLDAVADTISMPEFSEKLLALQGVSNGTYLGFKIPEKT
jgi:hypothetical protein